MNLGADVTRFWEYRESEDDMDAVLIVLRHNPITQAVSASVGGKELPPESLHFELPKGKRGKIVITAGTKSFLSRLGTFSYRCEVSTGNGPATLKESNEKFKDLEDGVENVQVRIPQVVVDGRKVVWYQVRVKLTRVYYGQKRELEFAVHRRFSEFRFAYTQICNAFRGTHMLSSVPKHPARHPKFLGEHLRGDFLESRQKELESWLRRTLMMPRVINNPDVEAFLGMGDQAVREVSVFINKGEFLGLRLKKRQGPPLPAPTDRFQEIFPQAIVIGYQRTSEGKPGVAERSGIVGEGDIISKVGGNSVVNLRYEQIVPLLKSAPRPLVVHFLGFSFSSKQHRQEHLAPGTSGTANTQLPKQHAEEVQVQQEDLHTHDQADEAFWNGTVQDQPKSAQGGDQADLDEEGTFEGISAPPPAAVNPPTSSFVARDEQVVDEPMVEQVQQLTVGGDSQAVEPSRVPVDGAVDSRAKDSGDAHGTSTEDSAGHEDDVDGTAAQGLGLENANKSLERASKAALQAGGRLAVQQRQRLGPTPDRARWWSRSRRTRAVARGAATTLADGRRPDMERRSNASSRGQLGPMPETPGDKQQGQPRRRWRLQHCLLAAMALSAALAVALAARASSLPEAGDGLDPAPAPPDQVQERPSVQRKPPAALGAEEVKERRHVVLDLDKPIYRPGDDILASAMVMSSTDASHWGAPFLHGFVKVDIVDGLDNVVGSLNLRQDRETLRELLFAGSFRIPAHFKGGDYEVRFTGQTGCTEWVGHTPPVHIAPAKRRFEVRVTSKSNAKLSMDLRFEKEGYRAGDNVNAFLENLIFLADGHPAAGATLSAALSVSGKEVASLTGVQADSAGGARLAFVLPGSQDAVLRGLAWERGLLNVIVRFRGQVEHISRTLPLLNDEMDVGVFPEHGFLIPGVPTRVYAEVRSRSTGRPLDIDDGEVLERGSRARVATLATLHEGRGRSSVFVPKEGVAHVLRIAGVDHVLELDPRRSDVAILPAFEDAEMVFDARDPIKLRISSPPGEYKVALFKRNALLEHRVLQVSKSSISDVSFLPPADALGDGVLRVTVYASGSMPVAERLLFRMPHSQLQVQTRFLPSETAAPGDRVKLEVETQIGGKPVSAFVNVAVTDWARASLVEPRRRFPTLAAAVFLEPEVRDGVLYDPNAFLESKSRLDLLLGTQGWRRFAFDGPVTDDFLRLLGLATTSLERCEQPHRARGRPGVVMMMARGGGGAEEFMAAGVPEMAMMDAAPAQDGAFAKAPNAKMLVEDQEEAVEDALMDEDDDDDIGMRAKIKAPPFRVPPRGRLNIRRVYAHERVTFTDTDASSTKNKRRDFQETLFFGRGIETKFQNGRYVATVDFATSDAVTSFQARVDAFNRQGVFGHSTALLSSSKPVHVDIKLPNQVVQGDVVEAQVVLTRAKQHIADAVTLDVELSGHVRALSQGFAFEPGQEVATLRLEAIKAGQATVVLKSAFDTLERSFQVRSSGFPVTLAKSGTLAIGAAAKEEIIQVPVAESVLGPVNSTTKVFLSVVEHMNDKVEGLIREPCGCFEQTSATTYPMVLALRFLLKLPPSAVEKHAELIARARDNLKSGYKRLVSFETSTGGFEWFGRSPGHEALTSYGLVQFAEMARPELGLDGLVDPGMVERTKKWLSKRRDEKTGSFLINERALDSFGRAPQHTTDAYILWSLSRAKLIEQGDFARNVEFLDGLLQRNPDDPYTLALSAGVLAAFDLPEDAERVTAFRKRLVRMQDPKTGCLGAEADTITMSFGRSRQVETTALAVLAWLGDRQAFAAQASLAVQQCLLQDGFGSTQGTALALHALIEFHSAPRISAGNLVVSGRSNPFAASDSVVVVRESRSTKESFNASLGLTDVKISGDQDAVSIPFTFETSYRAMVPPSDDRCKLRLDVDLAAGSREIGVGGIATLNVRVDHANPANNKPINSMLVAKVGLPGGVQVRVEHLRELVDSRRVAHFETTSSGFLVLYFMGLPPAGLRVPIQLEVIVPGQFASAASSAYFMYAAEHRWWVSGPTMRINK
ncbi:Complement C3 (HSE-MSF) [Cleaved into: Complement C3 beta chain, partial [Durusdinium trenchii]